MIILYIFSIITLLLLIITVFLLYKSKHVTDYKQLNIVTNKYDRFKSLTWISSIVSSFFGLLCLGVTLSYKSEMAEFLACKQTIENSRSYELSELERVSIQNEIIQQNKWLARAKYTNTLWINCVPDNIELLEPIK